MQSVQDVGHTPQIEGTVRGCRALPRRIWLAAVLLPFWLGSFAAFRPLAEPDEGRYTHIARWMTISGDWLVPRIDGLPFLHKPPLYYWLEALVIEVFGLHLGSARLVSILAALVTCGCVYHLVAARKGAHAATWSVAVLATSPLFFGAAQFANLDMLVSTFITLTLTFAVSAAEAPAGRDRALWLAAYASAALGVLSKGLIGAVLPAGIFVSWSLIERRPDLIRRALSPLGVVLFLAITAPWFVALELRYPGFNHFFFIYHHIERFLTDEFNGHYGPWFYPLIVFCGVLPWSIAFVMRLLARPVGYDRVLDALALAPLRRLAVVWLALVMVFFSLPSSKMIGYILPVLPAFAMLAGPLVARWDQRRSSLVIAVGVCIAFGIVGPHWQKRTPVALASIVATDMHDGDAVIMMDNFYYDCTVTLDRARPIYVGGFSWKEHAGDLPDSLHRQLVEGKEFSARAGHVLIDDARFESLTRHTTVPTWVIVNDDFARRYPWLANTPVLGQVRGKVLIKVEPR